MSEPLYGYLAFAIESLVFLENCRTSRIVMCGTATSELAQPQ